MASRTFPPPSIIALAHVRALMDIKQQAACGVQWRTN